MLQYFHTVHQLFMDLETSAYHCTIWNRQWSLLCECKWIIENSVWGGNALCKNPLPRETRYRNYSNLPHDPTSRRLTKKRLQKQLDHNNNKSPRLRISLHSQQMEFVFRHVLSKWKGKTWGWRKTFPAVLTHPVAVVH